MLTVWTFDPVPLAAIAIAGLAYARRLRTLRSRGMRVERRRCAAFSGSLLVLVLAVASPIDAIGEERLFSVHMLQHLMIGDVAPLFAVLGLSGPLLRPILAIPHTSGLRFVVHPLVSLPLWAANLYAWHVPLLYDATLEHPLLHAAEHALFFGCGIALWATILEVLPGPAGVGRAQRLCHRRGSLAAEPGCEPDGHRRRSHLPRGRGDPRPLLQASG